MTLFLPALPSRVRLQLWQKHETALANDDSYDENLHYPVLLKVYPA